MAQLNALGETFFKGFKKKVYLEDYHQLQTRAEEKRKKLFLHMELSIDTVQGMPGWIADAYGLLQKKDAHAEKIVFAKSTDMPGMTIQSYDTPETKQKHLLLTGSDFRKFVLNRVGMSEAARYYVHWVTYTKDSTELHKWCQDYHHADVFMNFEQGQMDLALTTDAEQDEDDENTNTMDPSRDAEFATAKTKKPRSIQ